MIYHRIKSAMKLNSIKKLFFLLILTQIFTLNPSLASDFGSYGLYNSNYQKNSNINYKAYALNQSLNGKKRQASLIRQRNAYYSNPTRNIRYPNKYNQYPNIQRNYSYQNSYRTQGGYRGYRYY